jgi:hypothetical protein
MSKFLTAGVITGALTFAAAIATAAGKPALAAVLSDPATASTATTVLVGLGAVVAGLLQGPKKDA